MILANAGASRKAVFIINTGFALSAGDVNSFV